MGKIEVYNNKTLKLSNVIIKEISMYNENKMSINRDIEQMISIIKINGSERIGPLIQHTKTSLNLECDLDIEFSIMLQCDKQINYFNEIYSTRSLIRITNCMYCRYIGPEEKMQLAYDKLNIIAFENDIVLSDEIYTIFISNENSEVVVDIFMPKNM